METFDVILLVMITSDIVGKSSSALCAYWEIELLEPDLQKATFHKLHINNNQYTALAENEDDDKNNEENYGIPNHTYYSKYIILAVMVSCEVVSHAFDRLSYGWLSKCGKFSTHNDGDDKYDIEKATNCCQTAPTVP